MWRHSLSLSLSLSLMGPVSNSCLYANCSLENVDVLLQLHLIWILVSREFGSRRYFQGNIFAYRVFHKPCPISWCYTSYEPIRRWIWDTLFVKMQKLHYDVTKKQLSLFSRLQYSFGPTVSLSILCRYCASPSAIPSLAARRLSLCLSVFCYKVPWSFSINAYIIFLMVFRIAKTIKKIKKILG